MVPGIFKSMEHFKCTTSSCEITRIKFSEYVYIRLKVNRLWLKDRKYGSSFIYSRKSFIQPIFHLKSNPRPPSATGWETIGHAVDSSAIIIQLGYRSFMTVFNCFNISMASRFSFPPYIFGSQLPKSRP